jgi:hypothetical protein
MHDRSGARAVRDHATAVPPRLSAAHLRFLALEQGVGAALFNAALNAGIAWLLFRGRPSVPLWGVESVGGDTLVTAFVLPLLTALIVTPLARGRVRGAVLPHLPWTRDTHGWLRWRPASAFRRGVLLGAVSVAAVAVPTVAALALLHPTPMTVGGFVAFKAAFAGALAALVTPVVGLWALTDAGASD